MFASYVDHAAAWWHSRLGREMSSVGGRDAHPASLREMHPVVLGLADRIRRWQERTGDSLDLPTL